VIRRIGIALVIVTGHIDLSVELGRRLHRRDRRGADGALTTCIIPASIACLAPCADRAAQGYGGLFQDSVSVILPVPACWCFQGLALAVLQGQSVGPFSPTSESLRFHSRTFHATARLPPLAPDRRHDGRLVWSMSASRTTARRASHARGRAPTDSLSLRNETCSA